MRLVQDVAIYLLDRSIGNIMKQYKVTQCKVESLKPGDMVLSQWAGRFNSWYSFRFIRMVRVGTLEIRGGQFQTKYGCRTEGTTFYKVENDFPFIWNEPIDKYNLNIGV